MYTCLLTLELKSPRVFIYFLQIFQIYLVSLYLFFKGGWGVRLGLSCTHAENACKNDFSPWKLLDYPFGTFNGYLLTYQKESAHSLVLETVASLFC